MLPAVTATPDEAEDLAEMMSDIETYVEEMFVKFITGQEPLDNFDAFQSRPATDGHRTRHRNQAGGPGEVQLPLTPASPGRCGLHRDTTKAAR